jgi:hypothetical protein
MRFQISSKSAFSRFVSARQRARYLLLSGLTAMVCATGAVGCKARKDATDMDMQPVEFRPLSTRGNRAYTLTDVDGKPMRQEAAAPMRQPQIEIGHGARHDIGERGGGRGVGRISAGFRGEDADYIDKADVYWKLNWIRKQLLAGLLPSNLEEAIEKTRRQLLTTKLDKNYQIADEAVTQLEKGSEHLRAHRKLQAASVPLSLIPWSAGRNAVERFLDDGHLGFGGKDRSRESNRRDEDEDEESTIRRVWRSHQAATATTLTARQQEALTIIREYAERHRVAPEEMMKRAWRRAIEKINELRDELGLMDRAENRDGDSAYIPTSIDAASPREPMDLLKNTVPIPEIHGETRRNLPGAATTEPDDPFASK